MPAVGRLMQHAGAAPACAPTRRAVTTGAGITGQAGPSPVRRGSALTGHRSTRFGGSGWPWPCPPPDTPARCREGAPGRPRKRRSRLRLLLGRRALGKHLQALAAQPRAAPTPTPRPGRTAPALSLTMGAGQGRCRRRGTAQATAEAVTSAPTMGQCWRRGDQSPLQRQQCGAE